MYKMTYHTPGTLSEAVSLFSSTDEPAYLSGGHTLIPAMKGRLAAPANLIDLRRIPELHGIVMSETHVTVGAAATHDEVAHSKDVGTAISVLAGLAGSIGDVHVRHLGTLGGSVANNDPAADYPAAVLALDASIETDRRRIGADDFFAGLYSTALEEGEIIVRIAFRRPLQAGYAKFRNPVSRYAMAAVFVARFEHGVRVAVTGAGVDGVFRWTQAEEALSRRFEAEALSGLAVDPNAMMGDMHAHPSYRAHLVSVMARRAVENIGVVTVKP
ncbi:FAD binding domain-containing protein [Pseudochelatococcus sp. B33]